MEKKDEGSTLTEEVARIETEIAEFRQQRDDCMKRIRELRDSEDFEAGITHARDIFVLQQDKLRLDVEIDFRRKKINRLLTESGAGGLN